MQTEPNSKITNEQKDQVLDQFLQKGIGEGTLILKSPIIQDKKEYQIVKKNRKIQETGPHSVQQRTEILINDQVGLRAKNILYSKAQLHGILAAAWSF